MTTYLYIIFMSLKFVEEEWRTSKTEKWFDNWNAKMLNIAIATSQIKIECRDCSGNNAKKNA